MHRCSGDWWPNATLNSQHMLPLAHRCGVHMACCGSALASPVLAVYSRSDIAPFPLRHPAGGATWRSARRQCHMRRAGGLRHRAITQQDAQEGCLSLAPHSNLLMPLPLAHLCGVHMPCRCGTHPNTHPHPTHRSWTTCAQERCSTTWSTQHLGEPAAEAILGQGIGPQSLQASVAEQMCTVWELPDLFVLNVKQAATGRCWCRTFARCGHQVTSQCVPVVPADYAWRSAP